MKESSKASIVLNSVFWGIVLAIIVLALFLSKQTYTLKYYAISFGIFGFLNIATFYTNYIYLIPELIKKKKQYWWYIFFFILLIAVVTTIKVIIAVLNQDVALRYSLNGQIQQMSLSVFIINSVFSAGFFLVSSCIINFAVEWYANDRVQRDLQSEKKDMEIQFLKSQFNPHFLFNSLNNIYSLAYQKSDKTADAILKLSEIMRYMIYESNDSWVSLEKEVQYVKSYVELQKLRFKDGAAVEFTINGQVDGQKIVPLILISFVENAFKHGVANDMADPIRIDIIANQKIMHFSITNKKNANNKDAIGGVGLNNVERRLQLLYPDRYKLNVVNTPTHYTVELILDL